MREQFVLRVLLSREGRRRLDDRWGLLVRQSYSHLHEPSAELLRRPVRRRAYRTVQNEGPKPMHSERPVLEQQLLRGTLRDAEGRWLDDDGRLRVWPTAAHLH